jgi:Fe-S-cluster containining protein
MAEGLRFECQPGCTECCRQKGFVYLTPEDLMRMAEFTGMTAKAFEKKYVYRTSRQMRLRVPQEATCPFLEEGGCSIHPAKPTQCRIFPFWPELANDKREWRKAAAWCPGIGKGELVQIETVRQQAAEMRVAYPGMYS